MSAAVSCKLGRRWINTGTAEILRLHLSVAPLLWDVNISAGAPECVSICSILSQNKTKQRCQSESNGAIGAEGEIQELSDTEKQNENVEEHLEFCDVCGATQQMEETRWSVQLMTWRSAQVFPAFVKHLCLFIVMMLDFLLLLQSVQNHLFCEW